MAVQDPPAIGHRRGEGGCQQDSSTVREALAARIPEIANGAVEIVAVSWLAGVGAKVAVHAQRPVIDAASVCIGAGGSRIRDVETLLGERISIVSYHYDPAVFVTNALEVPVLRVELAIADRHAVVVVDSGQFLAAYGLGGHNVHLASGLTGWHIELCTDRCHSKHHVHPRTPDAAPDRNEPTR